MGWLNAVIFHSELVGWRWGGEMGSGAAIFPRSCNWATKTLYTEEPFLAWLKDFLTATAP
jgi:hypothetical protein